MAQKVKNQTVTAEARNAGSIPGSGDPLRGKWQPTPVSLHGESNGPSFKQYSYRVARESDTTEQPTEHQLGKGHIQWNDLLINYKSQLEEKRASAASRVLV